MITQCPKCMHLFEINDEFDGRQIDCSKCGQEFTITPYIEPPTAPPMPPIANEQQPSPAADFGNNTPKENSFPKRTIPVSNEVRKLQYYTPFVCHMLNICAAIAAIPITGTIIIVIFVAIAALFKGEPFIALISPIIPIAAVAESPVILIMYGLSFLLSALIFGVSRIIALLARIEVNTRGDLQ